MTALKFYKSRDTAVAALRKAGVPKEQYSKFLAIGPEGFAPRLDLYESERLAAVTKVVAATAVVKVKEDKKAMAAAKAKPVKTVEPKLAKTAAANRNGISEWIRGLINAGKTNAEIKALAPAAGYDLTGKRAYFAGWYRWDMAKKAAAGK